MRSIDINTRRVHVECAHNYKQLGAVIAEMARPDINREGNIRNSTVANAAVLTGLSIFFKSSPFIGFLPEHR